MSGYVQGERGLCPSGKVSFHSQAKARKALRRLSASPVCQCYLCPECGHWHLTKSRTRDRRRR